MTPRMASALALRRAKLCTTVTLPMTSPTRPLTGRVVALDVGLALFRLAHDEAVHGDVSERQQAEDAGHARVDTYSGRNKKHDADNGGQLLAQRAEPEPEQRVRALQDGANDGARSAVGVIAGRQGYGALEGVRHSGKMTAMGHAIGMHGHDDAR